MAKIAKEDIKGLESKGVGYFKSHYNPQKDLIVAKEIVHLKDGSRVKRLRLKENYEFPFWITKPDKRNHRDKKASELEANLMRYFTTGTEQRYKVAKALNFESGGPNSSLKELAESPYVYGLDISPVSWFKYEYLRRYPDCTSPNEVATLDIETDMNSPGEEIILLTITMKEKLKCFIWKKFLAETPDNIRSIGERAKEHLGETLARRNIKPVLQFCDTPGEIVAGALKELHAWQPDYLIIWNAMFDVPKLQAALVAENYDPAEVFSDPRIPKEYRHFKIAKGRDKMETASGVKKSKALEDIWNWFEFPASFIIMDAMCTYNAIRFGAKEQSYALDYILQQEKIGTKLRIPGTDKWSGRRWHEVVQKRFPIEYVIYNWADDIRMEELDERTTDISMVVNEISAYSDFRIFHSGPRRLCDKLHFWYLDTPLLAEKRIMGSTPKDWDETYDRWVIGHRNIIVTLPASMLAPRASGHIKNAPDLKTLTFKYCADSDIRSTYPTASVVLNASPETILFEFSRIKGISENRRLALGINLSNARGNAIPIATEYFGAPKPSDWLREFDLELAA